MRGLWNTVFKGGIIGAAMIVPGVSGGTMAIILGIYDRLISAVSSYHDNCHNKSLAISFDTDTYRYRLTVANTSFGCLATPF